MRSQPRARRLLPGLVALLWLIPATGRPCGPGVHVRDAQVLLELLVTEDPLWAADAETPLALSYLQLGSLAPDFQWATSRLGMGHDLGLAYHLLNSAQTPEQRLFALGHLAHQASDPVCEGFFAPALFASAPLGMFDLFTGDDGPRGETETIVEGFGDLIVGDWSAVVDLLYDFWFEDEAAVQRMRTIVGWYCETGAAFYGRRLDCPAVVAELEDLLDRGAVLLGGLDREQAREVLLGLVQQPPAALVDLFTSGLLSGLLGGELTPSAEVAAEAARFKETPLVDPVFWRMYDERFADLGPIHARARLHQRTQGWPSWNPNSLICGNLQSMLEFLPDEYATQPGLIVDSLEWRDEQGRALDEVDATAAGRTLEARVRFFAAWPFTGTVEGVVKQDQPGWSGEADPVLGSGILEVDLDPAHYVSEPRSELVVPFTVDVEQSLGFYVELRVQGDSRPFFTTSLDRVWTSEDLDLDRPLYRDNFATYGRWPPSLPVSDSHATGSTLRVQARVAPRGKGLPGVEVSLQPGDQAAITAANGGALFDLLPGGDYQLTATAAGYLGEEPRLLTLADREERWVQLPLHLLPVIALPGPAYDSTRPLRLTWNGDGFDQQQELFLAQAFDLDGTPRGEEQEVGAGSRGALTIQPPPPDGGSVTIRLRARYKDGTFGPKGESSTIVADGSPPTVVSLELREAPDQPGCLPAGTPLPWLPRLQAELRGAEPHTDLVRLAWRPDEGAWREVPGEAWTRGGPDGAWQALLPLEDPDLEAGTKVTFLVVNAAGLEATVADQELPTWGRERLCAPTDEDAGGGPADTGPEEDLEPSPTDGGTPEDDLAMPADVEAGGRDLGTERDATTATDATDASAPVAAGEGDSGCQCGIAPSAAGPRGAGLVLRVVALLVGRTR